MNQNVLCMNMKVKSRPAERHISGHLTKRQILLTNPSHGGHKTGKCNGVRQWPCLPPKSLPPEWWGLLARVMKRSRGPSEQLSFHGQSKTSPKLFQSVEVKWFIFSTLLLTNQEQDVTCLLHIFDFWMSVLAPFLTCKRFIHF